MSVVLGGWWLCFLLIWRARSMSDGGAERTASSWHLDFGRQHEKFMTCLHPVFCYSNIDSRNLLDWRNCFRGQSSRVPFDGPFCLSIYGMIQNRIEPGARCSIPDTVHGFVDLLKWTQRVCEFPVSGFKPITRDGLNIPPSHYIVHIVLVLPKSFPTQRSRIVTSHYIAKWHAKKYT